MELLYFIFTVKSTGGSGGSPHSSVGGSKAHDDRQVLAIR